MTFLAVCNEFPGQNITSLERWKTYPSEHVKICIVNITKSEFEAGEVYA